MSQALYLLACVMFGVSMNLYGRLVSDHHALLPERPILLHICGVVSGIAHPLMFIYGFFGYPWWVPLLGLLFLFTMGAVLIALIRRFWVMAMPAWSMLTCGVGVVLAVYALRVRVPS